MRTNRSPWVAGALLMLWIAAPHPARAAEEAEEEGKRPVTYMMTVYEVPDVDDRGLYGKLSEDIAMDPAVRKFSLSISIVWMRRGHLTLAVRPSFPLPEFWRPDLLHWLELQPLAVESALRERRAYRGLFTDPKTVEMEREQAQALFDLARSLEKDERVKGVEWKELHVQRLTCPVCIPPVPAPPGPGGPRPPEPEEVPRERRVTLIIHYPPPSIGGPKRMAEIAAALGIMITQPRRDNPNILVAGDAVGGGLVEVPANDPRYEYLRINPHELGYPESRALLEVRGLWNDHRLRQEVVHVFPPDLRGRMTRAWQEFDRAQKGVSPHLRDLPVWSASYDFEQPPGGQWRMRCIGVSYSSLSRPL